MRRPEKLICKTPILISTKRYLQQTLATQFSLPVYELTSCQAIKAGAILIQGGPEFVSATHLRHRRFISTAVQAAASSQSR